MDHRARLGDRVAHLGLDVGDVALTVALIDGDLAAYRAAAATQHDIKWEDDEAPTIHANPTEAIAAALHTIRLWQETADCDKLLVCLTGKGNFRKSVYPLYKSNRSGVTRPAALEVVQAAIRETFPTATVDGLEADDLLGLALSSPKSQGKAVCVSMDKDLRTVPGLHLNPAKDRLPTFVTEAEANKWWFTQALTGDACDGYPGCRGIGPVKAEKLFEGWDGADLVEGFARVACAFTRQGADYHQEAIQQLRVARILRYGDYDKVQRKVRLWHPTSPEWLQV